MSGFLQAQNNKNLLYLNTLDSVININNYIYLYKSNDIKELKYFADNSESFELTSFSDFNCTFEHKTEYFGVIYFDITNFYYQNIVLLFPKLDKISFYLPKNKTSYKTGLSLKKSHNNELFYNSNAIKINIDSIDRNFKIYFKTSNFNDYQIDASIATLVYAMDKYKKTEVNNYIYNYFFLGIFILIFLLSVVFLYFNREKLFLYYALYVLLVTIINGSVDQIFDFFGASGYFKFSFGELCGGIAWIFYTFFLQTFMDMKNKYKKLYQITNLLKLAGAVFVLFVSINLFVLKNYYYYYQIRDIYLISIFALSTLIFIRLFMVNDLFAKIISFAGFITLSGWLIYLSLIQFSSYQNMNIVRTAQLLEVIIFGGAMAYQMRLIYKKHKIAQAEIIIHLKENKKLQDKVNKELEAKVNERTFEIMQKNENLKVFNEEILAQRDELGRQRDIVKKQHQKITDSIKYAKRIQDAALPEKCHIKNILNQYFILYQPHSIVSGDFYWIDKINNLIYVAAVDCTGHGVPGAFMSMLGMSFMNEIIHKQQIFEPHVILNQMREIVKQSLKQSKKNLMTADGMDIALCVINKKTQYLKYAGAYNPLYIIRKKSLIELKADRMPIGVYLEEKESFNKKEFQLLSGDMVYLFTDGYADQIGGLRDTKFMSRKFKKLLIDISDLKIKEQKDFLTNTIEQWMFNREQTDDILVIGFRIK